MKGLKVIMRRKQQRFLLIFSLTIGIFSSQFLSTRVDASSGTFQQQVAQDDYQKTISKGFLGKSYGTGRNQYVCNTYVEKALESLQTTSPKESGSTGFKDISIRKGKKGIPTSYDWSAYRVKITYTAGELDETTNTYLWDSTTTTTTIKRHNKGTSLNNLALGDVLTYGKSGGHVALYFGEFDDMADVVDRLVELGVYEKSDLKKRSDRYVNKSGKPIVRQYEGCGTKWRIHATSKGLLIDNAIVSKSSNGTSSFGKWKKTIESGFTVYNEIVAE
jgi:hypothetical protein